MGMIIKRGKSKAAARIRRHERIRKHVSGTTERPRLVVTRSARHIVAQIVDDTVGKTLASASTMEVDLRSADGDKSAKAKKVGELIADPRQGRRRRRRRVRPRWQQVPRSRRCRRRRCPRGRPFPVNNATIEMRNI
jgi:ribosomal protein L18